MLDEIVSTEIPNEPISNYHLHNVVIRHMMHGHSGELNLTNVCKKMVLCQKKKNISQKVFFKHYYWKQLFPLYRCRDDGVSIIVRGKKLDNH